jgi:hypothetical protein
VAAANHVNNGVNALHGLELDPALARAQIDRLVASKTFEASEVHRRLLHYLAEKALAGDAERLKEYTIGIEAFGKPETYDPKQDSIVRLQIGRLRQKLAVYYQSEAAGDSVLVTLPKGAFKLNFEPYSSGDRSHAVEPSAAPGRWTRWIVAGLALLAIWSVVATVLLVRARRLASPVAERWSPELEELWQPILQSKRSLLVCLGTPLFVRFPNYGFFRDPRANDWQEIQKSERITATQRALGVTELLPSYNFTGAGEASAAFQIGGLLATRKPEIQLTRSSILSWQQIGDSDVVFLGPPKFNLQLQATSMAQDIVVEPDGIRNLKPAPGEPAFLADQLAPQRTSEGETHAVITRTSGPSGAGELLTIAGNASPDTMAAAEWMTQPWHAKELVGKLRGANGSVPRHFQVVLRVTFKQGIPVQSSYVFHHVLK